MDSPHGIVDGDRNPFANNKWIEQGYGLTDKRQGPLEALFGQTRVKIMRGDRNRCRYVAFVAIRWGFAELREDVLVPTEKWENRLYYDERGNPHDYVNISGALPERRPPIKKTASRMAHEKAGVSGSARVAPSDLTALGKEIDRRRRQLIALAHRNDVPMIPVEREHIHAYLEREELPEKPTSETRLMKEFVSSALSINQPPHRIRNRMQRILGDIPLADTIPLCLSKVYDCPAFLEEANWTPAAFAGLLQSLRGSPGDAFTSDVRRTLLGLAAVMTAELQEGMNTFYRQVDRAVAAGPEACWRFMEQFTAPIPGVGPGLMSDFLKNIGYPEFVKIDQRLKKEFPQIVAGLPPDPKSMFIFAVTLCRELGMTPFLFDHILYQWGNVKLKAYLNP